MATMTGSAQVESRNVPVLVDLAERQILRILRESRMPLFKTELFLRVDPVVSWEEFDQAVKNLLDRGSILKKEEDILELPRIPSMLSWLATAVRRFISRR